PFSLFQGFARDMNNSSVKQVRFATLGEFFLSGFPRGGDIFDRNPVFNLLAQAGRPRDHIERQTVVDVFVRRRLPPEIIRIKIVKSLDQRDAGDDGFESFPVEGVNWNPVAEQTGVLLKQRQKAVRTKVASGQLKSVELFTHPERVSIRPPINLKRRGPPPPFANFFSFDKNRP